VVVEAPTNLKAVDDGGPLGFVILLILFASLNVKDYEVVVSRFAVKYKKSVNIDFIVSKTY